MKLKVNYFVSYAHRNAELTGDLIKRLDDVLAPSRLYQYSRWEDTDLILGENWRHQIQEAINACDFGLLLISPAFLASSFIAESELTSFISGKKAAVPIMLQPVDFERHDLKGLQETQIFRFAPNGSSGPKAYVECKGARRDAFALELFRQIERKLESRSLICYHFFGHQIRPIKRYQHGTDTKSPLQSLHARIQRTGR